MAKQERGPRKEHSRNKVLFVCFGGSKGLWLVHWMLLLSDTREVAKDAAVVGSPNVVPHERQREAFAVLMRLLGRWRRPVQKGIVVTQCCIKSSGCR